MRDLSQFVHLYCSWLSASLRLWDLVWLRFVWEDDRPLAVTGRLDSGSVIIMQVAGLATPWKGA